MDKYSRLAFCGLYCGGCSNYKEKMNCAGCRDEAEMVSDCPTKACSVNKGILHCGECSDFPCSELHTFYNDGVRHHAMAFENIQRIKLIGLDEWLVEQEKEYTCECGKRLYWFSDKKCIHNNQ